MSTRRPVAVITGGAGGIGAAIAEELARRGWFVVTMDPLVSLDGSERLPPPKKTTAKRIVAAGEATRASEVSVTDASAVASLFASLVQEHGRLDAVVNVAGITRQTYFSSGTEQDWREVLLVHLGGYLNVLEAALPLMVANGVGRVLGVTSGSGWRLADAGAYSCAKRAVAALTWQLGPLMPPGITVNAISPIAATRMVAAALERARRAGKTGGGGVSFTAMPEPEELAPFGAYMADEQSSWCTGRVMFAGGSEVAVIEAPRLLEVLRVEGARSAPWVLDEVLPQAFASAEANQLTSGATNPRFGSVFDELGDPKSATPDQVSNCVLVSDRPQLAASIKAVLRTRNWSCTEGDSMAKGFDAAARALVKAASSGQQVDALVVAFAGSECSNGPGGWERVLAEHRGVVEDIMKDASWARAAADYSAAAGRPLRFVTLTDAQSAGGRSRAQAVAQLSRAAAGGTGGRVAAFAVSIEAPEPMASLPAAELVGHLLAHPQAPSLAGAELAVGSGWVGLRSHPRPVGSVVYGGPVLPAWFGSTLREIAGSCGAWPGAEVVEGEPSQMGCR